MFRFWCMGKRCSGILLLLLIVLASQEMVVPNEAKVCQSRSRYFKGPCNVDHICAIVCRDEAFSGGRCKFDYHRHRGCFCTKLC